MNNGYNGYNDYSEFNTVFSYFKNQEKERQTLEEMYEREMEKALNTPNSYEEEYDYGYAYGKI